MTSQQRWTKGTRDGGRVTNLTTEVLLYPTATAHCKIVMMNSDFIQANIYVSKSPTK